MILFPKSTLQKIFIVSIIFHPPHYFRWYELFLDGIEGILRQCGFVGKVNEIEIEKNGWHMHSPEVIITLLSLLLRLFCLPSHRDWEPLVRNLF